MRFFFNSIPGRTLIFLFIFTIIWTIFGHMMGYNSTHHDIGQYTRMVTALVFYLSIGYAILRKRKQQQNVLGFAEGFRTGLAITVFYSLFAALWFALYAEVINRDYKPTLMEFESEKLNAAGVTGDKLASQMDQVDMMSGGSATSYILLFAFMALGGTIVSLIAATILRRAKR